MSDHVLDITVPVSLTPQQVAQSFWALDDSKMADFFGELERIAGPKLCMQMASAIDRIRIRAELGDFAPMNGLQTMLSHAAGYAETAGQYREWELRQSIGGLADKAKADIAARYPLP